MHGFPRPLIAPVDPLNGCGVGGCGRLRQLRIEAYVRNTRRMNCTNVRHSRRGASPLARGAILRQPRSTVAGQEQCDECGERGSSEEIDQKRHGFTFWRAVSPALRADN